MFESIRRLVKGWFGYAIMAGICLTFALWGVADYLGVGEPPVAAVVNGEEISAQEIDRQVERLQQTSASDLPELASLKRQLLSELITEKLLLQNAQSEHLKVSEKTILQYVQARPEFQDENGFSNALFQSLLAENGLTPSAFIDILKKDLVKNQLRDAVSLSGFITPYEINGVFDLMEQTRDVRYARLALENYAPEQNFTDEALSQHYASTKESYVQPEEVVVEYLELKRDDVKTDIKIDQEKVKNYFEENQVEFRTEEKRKIAHILVTKDEEAEEKLKRIEAAIEKGDSFNSLVKAYSVDTISSKSEGVLGVFTKNALPNGFAEEVFSVKNAGDYTAAFETDFGWHIVKVLEINPEKQMSFAEASSVIEQQLLDDSTNDRMVMLEEDLAQITFEAPDTLIEAAKALALKINTTNNFTRNTAKGLFANPKLLAAVFSDEVLLEKNNSSVIKITDDHLVVVRVKEHIPEKLLSLAEVKGRIKADLAEKVKKENAMAAAKQIIEKLQASKEEREAALTELTWKVEKAITRNDTRLPFPLTSVVFQKPVNPSFYSIEVLANGDIALFSILKRDQKLLEAERAREQAYSKALVSRTTGLEFLLFANSLEGKSDIELMEDY